MRTIRPRLTRSLLAIAQRHVGVRYSTPAKSKQSLFTQMRKASKASRDPGWPYDQSGRARSEQATSWLDRFHAATRSCVKVNRCALLVTGSDRRRIETHLDKQKPRYISLLYAHANTTHSQKPDRVQKRSQVTTTMHDLLDETRRKPHAVHVCSLLSCMVLSRYSPNYM
jgi:hypothetical protein